jgi:hypothetical protein
LRLKIPQSWNRADVPKPGNKYDSHAHGFAFFNQRIFGRNEARICEDVKEWSTFMMNRDRVLEGSDFSAIAQPIPQLSGHIHHPMLHSLSTVALFSYPFPFLILCKFPKSEVGWVHGDANVTSQGWLRFADRQSSTSSPSPSPSALDSAPHYRSNSIARSHNDALQAAGCHLEARPSCIGSQGQQLGEDAEIVCSVLMLAS